jgi:hypothetical protein
LQLKALGEMKQLINNKNLLVTESDKGGFICLLDPPYVREMDFKTLEDTTLFRPAAQDCEEKTLMEIKKTNQKP